jgi:HAD superfamily hydrolase (TIGR01549 family)
MMIFDSKNTKIVRAILFDLSGTITENRKNVLDMHREAAEFAGFDMAQFSDDALHDVQKIMIECIDKFQEENNVGIHWGEKEEDWLKPNRVFVEALGFKKVPDAQLVIMETYWKEILATKLEALVEGAAETLEELKKRGYILGICTRRFDNPKKLLKNWGIDQFISTIQYSAVLGYAKPSPFTLLKAADEIGINPRHCAYVGNLVDLDIYAAMSAEMLPILTIWSDPKERELAPDSAIVIDIIDELLNLFEGPPNQKS